MYLTLPSIFLQIFVILFLQWQAKVERGQEEFDTISQMIKKEMERFEINRVKDFKETVIIYLENLMLHQQQVSFLELGLLLSKFCLALPLKSATFTLAASQTLGGILTRSQGYCIDFVTELNF